MLRNHPIVLAQFARHFVEGQSQAAQEGLAAVRTGLQDFVEPSVLEEATQAWLEQSARLVRARRAVEKAVSGMLPKNSLGRQMLSKLKVYAGDSHPHAAQQPVPFEISQVAQ